MDQSMKKVFLKRKNTGNPLDFVIVAYAGALISHD